jgi:hypothetical protein
MPISSPAATCTATGPITTYLNWFDNASPGMQADNIHILNTNSPSSGCVTVGGGQGVSWSLGGLGSETYITMPPGTYGGPVRVTINNYLSGAGVVASQRIQFHQSFNELPAASAGQAATTSYFNWYDKASPGMLNDNIHVLNPGTAAASVTVNLPGATPQTLTVASGAEAYTTFPQGTIGGPVTVSSTQPVLASQRVQFHQSFSEVWASSLYQPSTKSYFNWYDSVSPGVAYDNIHLLNPGGTGATVTVSLPGTAPRTVSVAAGAETYVNFPGMIGGLVTVSSDQPILASERVQFYSSFNEIWSASQPSSSSLQYYPPNTSFLLWYDKASAGMYNDNVHLANPGSMDATVNVSVGLLATVGQTVTVPAGGTSYVSFPGTIGGPVKVASNQPVFASQRVQYYQSFSESWAG